MSAPAVEPRSGRVRRWIASIASAGVLLLAASVLCREPPGEPAIPDPRATPETAIRAAEASVASHSTSDSTPVPPPIEVAADRTDEPPTAIPTRVGRPRRTDASGSTVPADTPARRALHAIRFRAGDERWRPIYAETRPLLAAVGDDRDGYLVVPSDTRTPDQRELGLPKGIPRLESPELDWKAERVVSIAVRAAIETPGVAAIRFRRAEQDGYPDEQRIEVRVDDQASGDTFRDLIFPVGDHPHWHGRIAGLRLELVDRRVPFAIHSLRTVVDGTVPVELTESGTPVEDGWPAIAGEVLAIPVEGALPLRLTVRFTAEAGPPLDLAARVAGDADPVWTARVDAAAGTPEVFSFELVLASDIAPSADRCVFELELTADGRPAGESCGHWLSIDPAGGRDPRKSAE